MPSSPLPATGRPLWARLLLVLSSSILVTLVFPPFHCWQLALVAWIPLLFAVAKTSARMGFRLGLLAGIATFGGTLIWLWEVFRWPAIGLWLILGCFVGIFCAWFASRPSSLQRSLWLGPLAALMWTGIEYFRCEWFHLRFPWITPGTGFPPTLLSPLIGTYGLSFLLILGGAWLTINRWAPRALGVLVLVTLSGVAMINSSSQTDLDSAPVRLALIQCEEGFFDEYYDLTLKVDQRVDAIVWPEYALDYDVRTNPRNMEKIADLVPARASFLVLGSQSFDEHGKRHNTAFTIGAKGEVLGQHHKNRPVHFFDDGEAGRTLDSFETPLGRIATPVCFDCDYTEVTRKLVLAGAELILVPSMDARHWTTRQHQQHAQLFRHRAAENRRWLAVAATSGVTQVIAPNGQVMARLHTMAPGHLLGSVGMRSDLTFFTRWGWLLGPVSVMGALITLVLSSNRLITRRRGAVDPIV